MMNEEGLVGDHENPGRFCRVLRLRWRQSDPWEAIPLRPLKHSGGKNVHAWAVRGDFDPDLLRSNTFPLEWPPKSGRIQEFPEVDRAAWFPVETARQKILKGQAGFLDQLQGLHRQA